MQRITAPTARPQNGGHPSTPNPPPLQNIPKAPVRQGTPWPNAGSTSENLFETRKDWPFPPTPVPTSAPTVKTEAPTQVAAIPRAMVAPRKAAKNHTWGPHCPICEEDGEHEEDWDGNLQNPPRMLPQMCNNPSHRVFNILSPVSPATPVAEYPAPPAPTLQCPQPQNNQQSLLKNTQCPHPQNSQQSYDIPNRYMEQIKLRREWKRE